MNINTDTWRAVRETIGVILMVGAFVLAATFLVATAGPGATIVTAALLALAALGRWLARGTDSETDDEFKGESQPLGPGPLWQDPDDPQAFIPRPERD